MVIRLASGEATVVDYRQEAPARSSRDMYLDARGNLVPEKSTVGGLSVAVPGTVAGLALAEQKYGKLGLERVMQPSIRLAEEGFPVSFWLSESLKGARDLLARFDESRRIFLRNGNLYQPGEIFKQPELGATLGLIAQHGPAAFYTGPTAKAIAATIEKYHGIISLGDLEQYQAKLRNPLIGQFRGYRIVAVPPPSSGGVALLEMLNILEPLELGVPNSFQSMHLMVETMRRAYADRAALLGDADFVRVPVAGLTSRSYAAKLREQILSGKPGQAVRAGDPVPYESSQTTHYSVVDTEGNAVSNTYTLNDGYGSGVTIEGAGFLLNDQMDDFAAKPGSPNMFGLVQGEANSIAPHKRPLSSMTPTIALQEDTDLSAGPSGVVDSSVHDRQRSRVAPPGTAQGPGTPGALQRVRLVLGSPGGGTITNTVLQVLLNVLVFRMDVRVSTISGYRINWWWKAGDSPPIPSKC